jgi:hypothetical protein
MIFKDVFEDIEIENINDQKNNLDNVQHEEIFNKRNSRKIEDVIKFENNLKSQAQNLHHD